MPNIKSAKKRVRVSAARRERNKAGKSALRTYIKKARIATADKDANPQYKEVVKNAMVKLDKAACKGLIHRNKAARLKSRLAKRAS